MKTEDEKQGKKKPSVPNRISASESVESLPDPPKDYEKMLQKLEGDIRTHIRIEQ